MSCWELNCPLKLPCLAQIDGSCPQPTVEIQFSQRSLQLKEFPRSNSVGTMENVVTTILSKQKAIGVWCLLSEVSVESRFGRAEFLCPSLCCLAVNCCILRVTVTVWQSKEPRLRAPPDNSVLVGHAFPVTARVHEGDPLCARVFQRDPPDPPHQLVRIHHTNC